MIIKHLLYIKDIDSQFLTNNKDWSYSYAHKELGNLNFSNQINEKYGKVIV